MCLNCDSYLVMTLKQSVIHLLAYRTHAFIWWSGWDRSYENSSWFYCWNRSSFYILKRTYPCWPNLYLMFCRLENKLIWLIMYINSMVFLNSTRFGFEVSLMIITFFYIVLFWWWIFRVLNCSVNYCRIHGPTYHCYGHWEILVRSSRKMSKSWIHPGTMQETQDLYFSASSIALNVKLERSLTLSVRVLMDDFLL